jgi:hypothetical protein
MNYNIGDDGTLKLAQSISKLTKLRSLKIYLSNNSIGDYGAIKLGE